MLGQLLRCSAVAAKPVFHKWEYALKEQWWHPKKHALGVQTLRRD
jgi:hypothetical protein